MTRRMAKAITYSARPINACMSIPCQPDCNCDMQYCSPSS